jgi:hypothetical protein
MRDRNERGTALISSLLILMLMSGTLVGFIALVMADQRSTMTSRDQTTAYGAAHAGLEQLTSSLAQLFVENFRPTSAQVLALATTPPVLPGISFVATGGGSGYVISFTDSGGFPVMEATPRLIGSGPFQGLQGTVTPYTIEVTARTATGAEVKMRRTMQTVLIPAFQFGLFSDNDLSFFAGPDFDFGGRVHTNSNLYVTEGDGNDLTLSDRVSAFGEVIRTNLSNGWPTSSSYTGNVRILTAPGVYRNLARTEGSLVGTLGSAQNEPTWTNLSVGTYNGYVRNGRTGARRLDLPLVQMGAQPVDLIRRPVVGSAENTTNPAVFAQRYFSRASLRILLSDTAEDLTTLPGVTATAPVDLSDLRPVNLYGGNPPAWYPIDGNHAPIASAAGAAAATYSSADGYWTARYQPLVDGYIKIEIQLPDLTTWTDVTSEILGLGFTGRRLSTHQVLNDLSAGTTCADPSPNAVIRFQRVKDDNAAACGIGSVEPRDFWPNVLFDSREGDFRDSNSTSLTTVYLGGVVHYVELDVANLARWFRGTIGASGPNADSSNGGYVVYFSDRRTNQRVGGRETGEYGNEDVINPASSAGTPNGVLDPGEDVNGNGVLDVYGQIPIVPANLRTGAPVSAATRPTDSVSARDARSNLPLFFRRALKLVDGAAAGGSTLTTMLPNLGLTIVSENPVYVQGNYNVSTAGTFGATLTDHRPSAVVADAVTLLSNNWNDIRSFTDPQDPSGRPATTTWYRLAVASGKTLAFTRPTAFSCYQDFGTDGGAHNFLRYIEGWGGNTVNYRGGLLSFFTSRQAIGTYKCCTNVYGAPGSRAYNFDSEFLQLSLLPPKPPTFRDVNTLTFRMVLRPSR